jgi:hypothetical protein
VDLELTSYRQKKTGGVKKAADDLRVSHKSSVQIICSANIYETTKL